MKWTHSRKGLIEGKIIAEAGDWVDIALARDHRLKYLSIDNRGLVDYEGETITVRKSMLTEVTEDAGTD